ncbi:MAG: radical SAM protein [Candidatus ainarchaeum sp.]|nr:radical SAM protein [Candidatus ainarchaeum sp.]
MAEINRRVLRGFPPHLEAKGVFADRAGDSPVFMAIHMKPVCNFRCRKCFVEGVVNKPFKEELTLREIEKIMGKAKDAGVLVFGITGAGEPLLDPKTKHVVKLANQAGFITHLATNASCLDKATLEHFLENNVTSVISLDSINPEEFSLLTGTSPAMLGKVISNISLAQEVFRGTRKEENGLKIFRLGIHITTSDANVGQAELIRSMAESADTLISLSPIAEIGAAEQNKETIRTDLADLLGQSHITVIRPPSVPSPMCGFFRFGLDLNFDGSLLLDAHAIETSGLLGNIREFEMDAGAAFPFMKQVKDRFINEFGSHFCPVRSGRIGDFAEKLRMEKAVLAEIKAGAGQRYLPPEIRVLG